MRFWSRSTVGLMAHASEPAQFLQNLAISYQVLACVHLLCDFQVLACIPPQEAVACEDVADIVGLPESQLHAVVRMTASVGFLSIPRPGYIAHSPLSSQFAANVGVLDAFAFLAETLAPCAIRMPEAASRKGHPSPYSLVFGGSSDYAIEVEHRWRLQRQAVAHSRLVMGNDTDVDAQCRHLLACLDWTSLGAATVVDVEGSSTALAIALASEHAALSVIVQNTEASFESIPPHLASRIRLQERPSTEQPIQDASVYIVHLASPSITQPTRNTLLDAVVNQFAVHLPILRQNPLACIVLLARVLPEVATPSEVSSNDKKNGSAVPASPQCLALYRNLVLHQLTRGRDHERADVLACVRRTSDAQGVLVVTNEIRGAESVDMVAFEIQYLASSIEHVASRFGSTTNGGGTSQAGAS